MNRRKQKSALRTVIGLAAFALFAALVFVVSAVEQGAALPRILWGVPALLGLEICARAYNRI